MTQDLTEMEQAAPDDNRPVPATADQLETAELEEDVTRVPCVVCEVATETVCHHCQAAICETHSYREPEGTLTYCRNCADELVGVCGICEALHARPCRECGLKVCEAHHKRVIERWGWGGAPGQGGVVSWFPMLRTYCQEHGRQRFDLPKPLKETFSGYDGSSPEW